MAFMDEPPKMINRVAGGITLSEFLSIIPKKTKIDHEWDKKEMKRVSDKLKGIELNPKTDLRQAITDTNKLMKKGLLNENI